MHSSEKVEAFPAIQFFKLRTCAAVAALAIAAVAPSQAGATSFAILFRFSGPDVPTGSLAVSPAGAFFGAAGGGANGSIFRLAPNPQHPGTYIKTVLYSFKGPTIDGSGPNKIIYKAGSIYGTTSRGGH